MPETFAARLIAERERLGLSRGDMTAIADVSRRTQFNYEQSVRLPDVSYLAALGAHGFDVSYLVTGNRSPRYGVIDQELFCSVFAAVETRLLVTHNALPSDKKAKLVVLVYQTAAEDGHVDPLVVQRAVDLLT
jgi:transcriptional regulator with XRE-family HTH domain